jgi:hypothetical protein
VRMRAASESLTAGISTIQRQAGLLSYACELSSDLKCDRVIGNITNLGRSTMGRGILLWMLGVPIPIILLLAMCSHS